jgi:hypothetical protein
MISLLWANQSGKIEIVASIKGKVQTRNSSGLVSSRWNIGGKSNLLKLEVWIQMSKSTSKQIRTYNTEQHH